MEGGAFKPPLTTGRLGVIPRCRPTSRQSACLDRRTNHRSSLPSQTHLITQQLVRRDFPSWQWRRNGSWWFASHHACARRSKRMRGSSIRDPRLHRLLAVYFYTVAGFHYRLIGTCVLRNFALAASVCCQSMSESTAFIGR
jgi:hypothetical protein